MVGQGTRETTVFKYEIGSRIVLITGALPLLRPQFWLPNLIRTPSDEEIGIRFLYGTETRRES